MNKIVPKAFKAPECPACGGYMKNGAGSCITDKTYTRVHSTAGCGCGVEIDYTYYIPNSLLEKEEEEDSPYTREYPTKAIRPDEKE